MQFFYSSILNDNEKVINNCDNKLDLHTFKTHLLKRSLKFLSR